MYRVQFNSKYDNMGFLDACPRAQFDTENEAINYINKRVSVSGTLREQYRTRFIPTSFVVISTDTKWKDDKLYNSHEDAVNRAQEMCKHQPNRKFYVAEIKSCYQAEVTVKGIDI